MIQLLRDVISKYARIFLVLNFFHRPLDLVVD